MDQPGGKKVSIILPTYNEVDNIGPMIAAVFDAVKEIEHEIIVVDDSSPDGTGERVRALTGRYPSLRLVTRTSDPGLVQAIQEGIRESRGELVIWMDADLSMSPSLIPDFIDRLENGADLVLGSRYIPGGGMKGAHQDGRDTSLFHIWRELNSSEDSFLSAMISVMGNSLLRIILRSTMHDFSSGYFGGRRETFERVPVEGTFVDYCISLPYRAILKGMNVVEIPMILLPRKHGKSKTSFAFGPIMMIAVQCFFKGIKLRLTVKDERRG